jgi:putative Holliday junction resolvase
MARLLALDVGTVRIGVAVSDATGFLASPYTTLQVSRDKTQIWTAIQHLIEETEAEGLVIGLPVSLDGQLHAQAQLIQSFAERLKSHIDLPVIFWDERLSTVEAERLISQRDQVTGSKRSTSQARQQSRGKRRHKGQQIDALAAAVILQDYLDHLSSKTGEKNL